MPLRAARLDCFFLAGGRLPKIPLRRSERLPNFGTARAVAIWWGGACRRSPAGAEGGGGLVARAESAPRASAPPRLAAGAQYNVRPEPPPQGHGVGFSVFGSQFKILNPKRCTDPKMSKRHRTSSKKLSGNLSGRLENQQAA